MRFDGPDDRVDGVLLFCGAARRCIAVIAESVAPVEPVGADVVAAQRFFRAREYGNLRAAQLGGIERIAGRLRYRRRW
jgi:hypothetical protein